MTDFILIISNFQRWQVLWRSVSKSLRISPPETWRICWPNCSFIKWHITGGRPDHFWARYSAQLHFHKGMRGPICRNAGILGRPTWSLAKCGSSLEPIEEFQVNDFPVFWCTTTKFKHLHTRAMLIIRLDVVVYDM